MTAPIQGIRAVRIACYAGPDTRTKPNIAQYGIAVCPDKGDGVNLSGQPWT